MAFVGYMYLVRALLGSVYFVYFSFCIAYAMIWKVSFRYIINVF